MSRNHCLLVCFSLSLLRLQDMMVAPFRCVDEINQGLDERNERLVFKRIVENSTKPPGPNGPTDHCGQYWLITPKLLPNLTDMEREAVNVLCIYNGMWRRENRFVLDCTLHSLFFRRCFLYRSSKSQTSTRLECRGSCPSPKASSVGGGG